MSGHNFFSQQIIIFFFTKTLMMMMIKMNVMISRIRVLILNKYWECHEITEYLKIYSWSKHVKQINEFLMMMWNMWWHFRFFIRSDKFCFGQTVFLNCLTECQTSCLGFFDMSVQILIIVWTLHSNTNNCLNITFKY
jgi:hypothetical protein